MAGSIARREPEKYPSNIHCHSCDEVIYLHDDCVLCQVVRLTASGDEFLKRVVFYDTEDPREEPEPEFSPIFMHDDCWAAILEEMQENLKNDQPVEHEKALDDCAVCGSDILDKEICGSVDSGQLIMSPRKYETVFDLQEQEFVICSACLTQRHEELENDLAENAFWPEVSQEGECLTCQRACCWRTKRTCHCACHTEEKT